MKTLLNFRFLAKKVFEGVLEFPYSIYVAKEYHSEDYTTPGKPMEVNTLKRRVHEAKARIKAGQFIPQEDLEIEMGKW